MLNLHRTPETYCRVMEFILRIFDQPYSFIKRPIRSSCPAPIYMCKDLYVSLT